MGATCTLVSCHIWLCRVWYVCYIYVICFSHCMSCYSFPANSPIYTSLAINIKLIYSVSIGSTVSHLWRIITVHRRTAPAAVGSTVENFITDVATRPHMGPLPPMVATIGWVVLTLFVNCKHYFLCTLLCLLQFSIFLQSEEGCCEYPKQRYPSRTDRLEPCNLTLK